MQLSVIPSLQIVVVIGKYGGDPVRSSWLILTSHQEVDLLVHFVLWGSWKLEPRRASLEVLPDRGEHVAYLRLGVVFDNL